MAESLRSIKTRIRSIENTYKITRAMEMISISKLRRVEDILSPAKAYFDKLEVMLRNVLSGAEGFSHPLLEKIKDKKKILLCVVTSDSGLCASYNENVIKAAEDFINQRGKERIELAVVGKVGFSYFKKQALSLKKAYLGFHGRPTQEAVRELSNFLTNSFLEREVGEVYLVYTHFESSIRHKPTVEKLLDIEYPSTGTMTYLSEPDYPEIIKELLPAYVVKKVNLRLLEAFASEHSVRAVTMRSATDNAKELIEALVLLRNKVRQATITKEVIEIISSAEALKG